MKFGIVGGIGPASTLLYYDQIINRVYSSTGDYPELVIDSIDMNRMLASFERGDDDAICDQLVGSIFNLRMAGADFAAISANTPHILFERINDRSPLPLLSIVEATVDQIAEARYRKVLVLGTGFMMKSRLYDLALECRGVATAPLSEEQADMLHPLFVPNLENGIVVPEDKARVIAFCEEIIVRESVDAVVLGCTEIPLMIREGDLSVPTVDTTGIHIRAIADILITDAVIAGSTLGPKEDR